LKKKKKVQKREVGAVETIEKSHIYNAEEEATETGVDGSLWKEILYFPIGRASTEGSGSNLGQSQQKPDNDNTLRPASSNCAFVLALLFV